MDGEQLQDRAAPGERPALEGARACLEQFENVIRERAKPLLRDWRRLIRGSADPTFPDECLLAGREVAAELAAAADECARLIRSHFNDVPRAWAAPVLTAAAAISGWANGIVRPCADLPALIMDGYDFLVDCLLWVPGLRARLAAELEADRRATHGNRKDRARGGRPRLQAGDVRLRMALQAKELADGGLTRKEAAIQVGKMFGVKVSANTLWMRLARADRPGRGRPAAESA